MKIDPTDNRTRSLPGRLTLTVGPDQGDLRGRDDKVLQAGLDYLHRLAENCTCSDNQDYGISIGHRDTDNLISGCRIERNEKVGILFRDDGAGSPLRAFRAPHRNRIEQCLIRDNGFKAEGAGVEVRGMARDLVIRNTCFEDSGEGKQKIGILIHARAGEVELAGNSFSGLESEVVQLEEG